MKRILYFDCYTGLSCKKLLEALLSLGADRSKLKQELGKLVFQKAEEKHLVTLKQAETVIEESEIKESIKERINRILKNTVQIPEVSEEALLELAAVIIAMDMLGFSRFFLSPITEGLGMYEGKMVPASAVMSMLEKYRIPVHFLPGEGEKITLLGAGIAACLMSEEKLPSVVYVEKTGLGDEIRAMILQNRMPPGFYHTLVLKDYRVTLW